MCDVCGCDCDDGNNSCTCSCHAGQTNHYRASTVQHEYCSEYDDYSPDETQRWLDEQQKSASSEVEEARKREELAKVLDKLYDLSNQGPNANLDEIKPLLDRYRLLSGKEKPAFFA